MFDSFLYNRVNKYIKYIRPRLVDHSEPITSDILFLSPSGQQITNVGHIITFMQSQLKIDISSATTVRKIGATAIARSCSESEARIVSRQMAHDPRVSANYYEATKDAKRAFDTMNKFVYKKNHHRHLHVRGMRNYCVKFLNNI